MQNDAKTLITEINTVFNVPAYKLRVSNPEVPKMYGLCKIHKTGEKMRKIVSNVNSPLVKIARWLVNEMKQFGSFEGFAIKNSFDFVEKLNDFTLGENQVMVSST